MLKSVFVLFLIVSVSAGCSVVSTPQTLPAKKEISSPKVNPGEKILIIEGTEWTVDADSYYDPVKKEIRNDRTNSVIYLE